MQNIGTTTCTKLDSTTTQCIGPVYTGANIEEWLFVVAIFIFFVSLMAWGRLFNRTS